MKLIIKLILLLFIYNVLLIKHIKSTSVFLEDYHKCREGCEIKNTNNNLLSVSVSIEYAYSGEYYECKNGCEQKNNDLIQDICERPSFFNAGEPSIETNHHLDSLRKKCQYFSNNLGKIDLDYIEKLYRYKELLAIDCTRMICYLGGGINTYGLSSVGKPVKPLIRNIKKKEKK
ncbi:hypothetical protein DICPUDRAFT_81348 [Dictyostelium purpureum]|uniref:Uncharacterized protein n=1 Tax=Dictyostelium purpureum TaxID=5786 RepID=F0ZT78_DICPU|nr:uncharacterized protein DICPUDRAFT_81348 [Dictyostelium purpureum]EGC32837.1 hypothetical protein DICPUDRAFT_81348 [Dictyostelium purpureum]|eukprot:XP_003290622.1 hypothetical protein DICPUDRAFT_81348 [Dictyostelium purpureum]